MVAGSSWATSYTWRDKIDSGHDRYVGQVNSGEAAFVNQQGLNADGTNDFSYTNNTFGRSFAGLKELNSHRKPNDSDQSLHGDFHHKYSQHSGNGRDSDHGRDTDHGRNTAPIPEPGTMALLGFGMLSLAVYGKLHIDRKS